jgi:ribosome maturation factor RimP
MASIELRHTVREIVEPTIRRLGFELVAVEWLGNVLRLSIDSASGVEASAVVRVSKSIEPLLDEADPIRGAYTLEVSSPGIERPVQRMSDFQRFVGYRAKIRLVQGYPRRRYTGLLLSPEGDEIGLEVDGESHRFHIDAVERAHLVLTLDEYQSLAGDPAVSNPVASRAPTSEENEDDHQ